MKVNLLFLDMDGVLVDFEGGVCKLFGVDQAELAERDNWEMLSMLGVTLDEFWERINEAGEEFWAGLVGYPWYEEVIDICKEHAEKVIFLSTPSRHVTCYTGKVRWLKYRFDFGELEFCLFGSKELFAAPGRLLVDDSYLNCARFISEGGDAMVFPAYGNHLRMHRGDMDYFSYNLERSIDGIQV